MAGNAFEGNTSLSFDTGVLTDAAGKYLEYAEELREQVKELDDLLNDLKDTGWTTQAGKDFQEMAKINWGENIEKYAKMLEMLSKVLTDAAGEYDSLVDNNIRQTKVNI